MKKILLTCFALCFIVLLTSCAVSCSGYEEEVYEVKDTFRSIEVDDMDASIIIKPSTDGKCRVTADENKSVYRKVEVKNGVLKIDRQKRVLGFMFFSSFKEVIVEIELPEKEYSSLKIQSVSGRIEVQEGLAFDVVELESTSGSVKFYSVVKDEIEAESTSGSVTVSSYSSPDKVDCRSVSGSVTITDIKGEEIKAKSTSGSIKLKNVTASDEMTLETTSGSINLDKCDGNEIYIESTSGSVKGTLLSEKRFKTKSTSGSINIPYSNNGGICEIKTTSGSVNIDII